MNTNLLNQTFNYNQFRSTVVSGLIKAGALTHGPKGWSFDFDQDLEGIGADTFYSTIEDAGDAVVPVLLNNSTTIMKAAA